MKGFLIKCLLFLVCFFAVERFCHKRTHGFRPYKIQTSVPAKEEWETPIPSNEELSTFFSQKFHFLDSGGECYVFASEDKRYILKLFKHHHMRPPQWAKLLPGRLNRKITSQYLQKHENFYTSCKLAYDQFRERTGLAYLHLNPTTTLNRKIKLFDAIGALHTLDLDKTPFALQERASMAYPTLTHLVSAQELDAAKIRLRSLVNLIMERCQAGLSDHDARKRNFGFVGNKAIELDLGSFTLNETLKEEAASRKILLLETMKLRRWVKKYTPALSEELEENIKEQLNSH